MTPNNRPIDLIIITWDIMDAPKAPRNIGSETQLKPTKIKRIKLHENKVSLFSKSMNFNKYPPKKK